MARTDHRKNRTGVIYIVTNGLNGRMYVGQTTKDDPMRRWRGHVNHARFGRKTPICEAIRTHGEEAFTFEVVTPVVPWEKLQMWEEGFIKMLATTDPRFGYNVVPGGKNYAMHPATKAKLRAARLGKPLTEECKAKLSAAHTGRKLTAEARAKLSAAAKRRSGVKHTDETKVRMRASHKALWERKRTEMEAYPPSPFF